MGIRLWVELGEGRSGGHGWRIPGKVTNDFSLKPWNRLSSKGTLISSFELVQSPVKPSICLPQPPSDNGSCFIFAFQISFDFLSLEDVSGKWSPGLEGSTGGVKLAKKNPNTDLHVRREEKKTSLEPIFLSFFLFVFPSFSLSFFLSLNVG